LSNFGATPLSNEAIKKFCSQTNCLGKHLGHGRLSRAPCVHTPVAPLTLASVSNSFRGVNWLWSQLCFFSQGTNPSQLKAFYSTIIQSLYQQFFHKFSMIGKLPQHHCRLTQ